MSALHTPGPWFDDGYRIHAPTDAADPREGRVIVEYKHVPDFNPADAPLITAAPKMGAALIRIINLCQLLGGDMDADGAIYQAIDALNAAGLYDGHTPVKTGLAINDKVVLVSPKDWSQYSSNTEIVFTVFAVSREVKFAGGAGVQVRPALITTHPLGVHVWFDAAHFVKVKSES